MSTERNKAMSQRFFEEVTNREALIDELFTPDFVMHIPGTPDVHGRQGLKQMNAAYRTAFPDLQVTVDDQVAEADRVVSRLTSRGTHRGALQGIAPTGKAATWTAVTITRFVGDMIAETWVETDRMSLMQQLGAIPAPARATA